MSIPKKTNGETMSINEEAAIRSVNPSTIYRRRVAAGIPKQTRAGRSTLGKKRRFFEDQIDWSKPPAVIAAEIGAKESSVVSVRHKIFGKLGGVARYIFDQEINKGVLIHARKANFDKNFC